MGYNIGDFTVNIYVVYITELKVNVFVIQNRIDFLRYRGIHCVSKSTSFSISRQKLSLSEILQDNFRRSRVYTALSQKVAIFLLSVPYHKAMGQIIKPFRARVSVCPSVRILSLS